MGELSHQGGGGQTPEADRARAGDRQLPDSVHSDGRRVPNGLAAQAVQQVQVGTQDLPIQSGPHPKPHHPLYRGDADAEAAALPHGEPLHDPKQNALRFVYRGHKAGTDRKAEAAVPIRHNYPRGASAAGYSLPVCRRVGHSC